MKSSVALNERGRDGACEGARARAFLPVSRAAGSVGSITEICVIIWWPHKHCSAAAHTGRGKSGPGCCCIRD